MARTKIVAQASRPSPPRGERRRRRQEEVVAAAVRMFYESGYSETSVEDIATELGILKGSLYYYIASKEDLLYAIVREVHAEVEQLLVLATSDRELPPLERLSNYISSQVEYNAHNAMKISVYYQDMDSLGTDRLAAIREGRQAIEGVVVDLIREAQGRDEIDRTVDPLLASHAVFAAVNWIYRWYKPGGRIMPDEIAAFVVQFVLHGLTGARVELDAEMLTA